MNIFAILRRRLGQEGYRPSRRSAFRQGDRNEHDDIPTLFKELASKVPDAQVLADLDHVASRRRATAAMPIVC